MLHGSETMNLFQPGISGLSKEFAPWAAYKTLWYLLGRGEMNSTAIDYSLLPDPYQLYGDIPPALSGAGQQPSPRRARQNEL